MVVRIEFITDGKPARLAGARDGGQVEIKRKVRDFDEDLQDEF